MIGPTTAATGRLIEQERKSDERDRQYDQNAEQIALIAELEAECDRLQEALRDVIGMLDDPTGVEHIRDMRVATLIAHAALKETGHE